MKTILSIVLMGALSIVNCQLSIAQVTAVLHADQAGSVIPKEIYGQFAEHLGSCIYGGLWVGENSDIPNTSGYRTDVLNALQSFGVPSVAHLTAAQLPEFVNKIVALGAVI